MILGVTGGIASGKSTVARMFSELGAPLVSADQLARDVVAPGSATLDRLVERFGRGILLPDGHLDRKALGDLIFADPQARADLNRITHPAIADLAVRRLKELEQEPATLVVYEAPLLFEAGAESRVDAVLVVAVDEKQQLCRLQRRDGLDEEAARARIAAQMSLAEKVRRADYVIENSSTLSHLKDKVRALFDRLQTGLTPPPGHGKNRG